MDKFAFIRRYYATFYTGIIVIIAVAISAVSFVYFHQKFEYAHISNVAKNILKNRDIELMRHLNSIAKNFAITNDTDKMLENEIFANGNFQALFYVKDGVVMSFSSKDEKLQNLDEFDFNEILSLSSNSGFYVSDFIIHAFKFRYFIAKNLGDNALLIAFAHPQVLREKLSGLEQFVAILNQNGAFLSGENGDIYAMFGENFNFDKQDHPYLIKSLNGAIQVSYLTRLDAKNFIFLSRDLYSEIGFGFYIFLFVIVLLGVLSVLIFSNTNFLIKHIIEPIGKVKNILALSDNAVKIDKLYLLKDNEKILDDLLSEILHTLNFSGNEGSNIKNINDVLKNSNLNIIIARMRDGKILEVSDLAKEIYGQDIQSKNVFEIFVDSPYEMSKSIQNSIYQQENYTLCRQVGVGGTFQTQIKKNYIVQNGEDCVLYIMFDISKYKNFYDNKRKEYEYLNFSPMVVMVYDIKNDKFTDVSQNSIKIWGYEAKKIINREIDFYSLIKPQELNAVKCEIQNRINLAKRKRERFVQTYHIRHKNNKFYKYQVFATLNLDTQCITFYFTNIDDSSSMIENLQSELKFYNQIIDIKLFATWEYDLLSNKFKFDGNYLKILNFDDTYLDYEFKISELISIIWVDDLPLFNKELNACANGLNDTFKVEFRIKNRKKDTIWINMQGRVSAKEDGKVIAISGTIEDITKAKEAQIELRLSAGAFFNSHEAMMICDENFKILRVNNAFCEVMNLSKDDVFMKIPNFLFMENSKQKFEDEVRIKLEKFDFFKDEIRVRRNDGFVFPALMTANIIKDSDGKITNYMIMFMEISKIKEKEEELKQIAHYDTLTGLPNRAYLKNNATSFLKDAAQKGNWCAVVFIDFDGFKNINDTYGHDVGDLFLQAVSKKLRSYLRSQDILARLGGDEFCALITGLQNENELKIALNRLLGISNVKFNLDGHEISTTLSIGAALYYGDEKVEFNELLSCSDKAMYKAKTSGKNGYFIYDAEQFDVAATGAAKIQKALNKDEFFMLYQPMVENGKIFAFELLLRWNHPNMGILLPNDFLFNIQELQSQKILAKFALKNMISFQKDFELPCSINIAMDVLDDNEFFEFFVKTLGEYFQNLSHDLIFEITDFNEKNYTNLPKIYAKYSKYNVKFVLNNANLKNMDKLQNMPFFMVKIDRNICLSIVEKYENIKILKAILIYAKKLGFKVGAQGIENALSLRLLNNWEFDFLQGNYIAKALNKEEIKAFIHKFSEVSIQPISKDEFNNFLLFLEYKNLVNEFIKLVDKGLLNAGELENFKQKFSNILEKLANIRNDKFNLNTELHKQILDILTLNYKNLSGFITEFKLRFEGLVKNMEET